jgi:hypothetical protein
MNARERWIHIAKLEDESRASKVKSAALKHKHQSKLQHMTDISNAVGIAMSIFNPCVLLLTQDEKNDKE